MPARPARLAGVRRAARQRRCARGSHARSCAAARSAAARFASGSRAARRPTTSTWRTSTGRPRRCAPRSFYETVTFLDGQFSLHDDFLCRRVHAERNGRRLDGPAQAGRRVPQRQDADRGRPALLDQAAARPQVGRDRRRSAHGHRPEADEEARQPHGSVRPQDAAVVLRLPAERHRLPRSRRLRPKEAGQHGPLAVQELPARAPDRARRGSRTTTARPRTPTSS